MKYATYILAIGSLLFWSGCETDITLDLPAPDEEIVVEGYIASGEIPYVILTRNQPFFGGFDLNSLEQYFVHDAYITLTQGTKMAVLGEICLQDIPEEFQELFAEEFGLSSGEDDEYPNVCFYVDTNLFSPTIIGEAGKTYNLRIESGEKVLTSKAHIPYITPLDSVWWRYHNTIDTLTRLMVRIADPDTVGNFVRYFTQANSDDMIPGFSSVFDDLLFNGNTFDVPVDRGTRRDDDYDIETYGYFIYGDTVTIRWAGIDKYVYDFYRTLEQEMGQEGPFAVPTVVRTNVDGGLGVFAAYGVYEETIIMVE